MRRLTLLFLAVMLMFTVGCRPKTTRYQAEFLGLFDTVTTIIGYAESKEEFTALAREIQEQLTKYHQLFDIYNSYEGVNNLKTINDLAGIAPVKVDQEIIALLLFAKEQYFATGGVLNIAFGPVLKIWHDYRTNGILDPLAAEVPPRQLLEEAVRYTAVEGMIIDEAASTVYLSAAEMRLDVGAVAKGYAVERVAQDLEAKGVASLLLSVGGNIRAIGGKPDRKGVKPWKIGIKNPDPESPVTQLCNVLIVGEAVVSSGSYERYYTVNGTRYHHIIDPTTLMPAAYFTSVTVIGRDSGLADAWSTALFNLPLEIGQRLVEGIDGVEALWVTESGDVIYSKGFGKYLEEKAW
ncbi:MAG TPA: FAD:protein FMN transferase [Hydrogenispora sp.]|jgi:thiamine biosynthesis lipoprotein|nr:FAD:protein FMN transferase [Hydrogenispora sp.]